MTPARISRAKILQPRQYAKTDSSVAATRMNATHTYASVVASNPNASTSAVTERKAPMPCANRFGRPGHELGRERQRRGEHARHELAERTERRTGEHARDEAVGERHDDPALVEREAWPRT